MADLCLHSALQSNFCTSFSPSQRIIWPGLTSSSQESSQILRTRPAIGTRAPPGAADRAIKVSAQANYVQYDVAESKYSRENEFLTDLMDAGLDLREAAREWERWTEAPSEKERKPSRNSRKRAVQRDEAGESSLDLDCDHFQRCSGCTLDTALDQPPVYREAQQFFSQRGFEDFTLETGDIWGWRCRARLAVRGSAEQPEIGLFQEGSHTVVNIPACRAHHPSINRAVELVRRAMTALGVQPYDEETGTGELRYIQAVLCTQHDTSVPSHFRYSKAKVQLSLVWNARDEKSPASDLLQPLAEALWRLGGDSSGGDDAVLHSVWANFQTSRTNVILGGRWRHLKGEQELWERIGGVNLCFTPASFGQANLQMFGRLLRSLQKKVRRGSLVTELYAGVGAIGLSVAASRACRRVRCVEVNSAAKVPFEKSLARLPDTVDTKLSWHNADAEESPARWLSGTEVLIVDPPRRGLGGALIDALRLPPPRGGSSLPPREAGGVLIGKKVEKRPWILQEMGGQVVRARGVAEDEEEREIDSEEEKEYGSIWPTTLVYVSCGWEAFREDCDALLEGEGGWHLDHAEGFQFFPGTDSMEVMAVFKRGAARKVVKKGGPRGGVVRKSPAEERIKRKKKAEAEAKRASLLARRLRRGSGKLKVRARKAAEGGSGDGGVAS